LNAHIFQLDAHIFQLEDLPIELDLHIFQLENASVKPKTLIINTSRFKTLLPASNSAGGA